MYRLHVHVHVVPTLGKQETCLISNSFECSRTCTLLSFKFEFTCLTSRYTLCLLCLDLHVYICILAQPAELPADKSIAWNVSIISQSLWLLITPYSIISNHLGYSPLYIHWLSRVEPTLVHIHVHIQWIKCMHLCCWFLEREVSL